MKLLSSILCLAAIGLGSASATADELSAQALVLDGGVGVEGGSAPPKPSPQRGVTLEAGMRAMLIPFAGFDPYSNNDLLPGFSVAGSATILRYKRLSLHAHAEYDLGLTDAVARGDVSTLAMHRFALGLSARLHVARRLEMFAKVAPSVLHFRASIADTDSMHPLEARSWSWNVDVSGGAALLLGSAGDPDMPYCRFWLTGELGYGFAGQAPMHFSPAQDDGDSRTFGTVELPGLRAQGVMSRLALAISF